MNKINLFLILSLLALTVNGQEQNDTLKEKPKTGFNFGLLPSIAYNTDIGFQYGGLTNLYLYGDGSQYPEYRHSLYLEWARTTKGSGINKIKYDSKYLIPQVRITSELNYLTEQALNFYGFNGYEVEYNPEFENTESSEYISRMYYRHERKLLRFIADFQGNAYKNKLRWIVGIGIFDAKIGPVDIETLNEGKDESDMLPDTAGLYDKYIDWGIIGENEKNGGLTNFAKLGLVYDTRDNEPNPMKGIWTEAMLLTAPEFTGNKDYPYIKLIFTHRQYFTIIK
ncbi:MAG: hypothetical protein C0594_02155, partial [Marinilabiliales bacterium]